MDNPVPHSLSEVSNSSKESQKAIWIASYPKSGNTWLRVFIHNLMLEIRGDSNSVQDINTLGNWSGRESLIKGFARRLGKPAHEATPAEIAAVRPLVQADIVRTQAPPVFIKTHNAVATTEGFSTINFDVTLAGIYIVRNPLDVAVSYAFHLGLSLDEAIEYMGDAGACTQHTDGKRVYEFMSTWSFHVASWISVPHRPVLVLRYEDLLSSPERSFTRLVSFLRLKITQEQLLRAIKKSSFEQLAEQEAKHGFRERPSSSGKFFRSGKSGEWRDVLSPHQVQKLLEIHSPMMMRVGYLIESCG